MEKGLLRNQAKQQSVRIMKFLKYCSEDYEDEVSRDFVDYCIGSPCLVSKFIEHSREEWSLTSSAQINYLQAIADMSDFRKLEGAAQSSARSFSLTEVCIHRGKRTLSKRKRYEWTKKLDIDDNLEAMNSWATLEELQRVVPFHYPRYNELLQRCKKIPDVIRCTRRINVLYPLCCCLFIHQSQRVKTNDVSVFNGSNVQQQQEKWKIC